MHYAYYRLCIYILVAVTLWQSMITPDASTGLPDQVRILAIIHRGVTAIPHDFISENEVPCTKA